jgi:hypothetical protein
MGMGEKVDPSAAKEMTTGSYAHMPKETRHFAWAKGETVIQIHGWTIQDLLGGVTCSAAVSPFVMAGLLSGSPLLNIFTLDHRMREAFRRLSILNLGTLRTRQLA